jgi:hypothetical protein
LAKSIPIVVIFIVDAPIQLSGDQHFHFGTLMPFRVGASIPLLSTIRTSMALRLLIGGAQYPSSKEREKNNENYE